MPSIVIKERDLTERLNQETITNVVYIPGYANQGPVNTPTLCETLEDFQRIFGTQPYKFRGANGQDYPMFNLSVGTSGFSTTSVVESMGAMYQVGESEKSYIMAAELLNSGLQVLYERVFNIGDDDANLIKWTATSSIGSNIEIKSSYPGLSSKLIEYKITDVILDEQEQTQFKTITIQVKMQADASLGISEIAPISTTFTVDKNVAQLSNTTKYIRLNESFIDNSGLVAITITDLTAPTVSSDFQSLSLSESGLESEDEFNITDLYAMINMDLKDEDGTPQGIGKLSDKGEYSIKYITSGAYPVFEYSGIVGEGTQESPYAEISNSIVVKMLTVAGERGDCTALIDHTPNQDRTLNANQQSSVYSSIKTFIESNQITNQFKESVYNYGAMFTPWVVAYANVNGGNYILPASFAYLKALAAQLEYTTDWLATAGVARGHCDILSLQQNVTNAIADSYQPRNKVAINPITNVKPYGYTIWGARTLKNNAIIQELAATSFLNIRQITNDVKRATWIAAKSLTFEQNTDILWIRFKGKLIPLLNQMVQGNAITSYEFIKIKTNKKATISAIIRMYPIEPVEDWDITIELADDLTVTTEG